MTLQSLRATLVEHGIKLYKHGLSCITYVNRYFASSYLIGCTGILGNFALAFGIPLMPAA